MIVSGHYQPPAGPSPRTRLFAARDQVTLLEQDLRGYQSNLKRTTVLQKVFARGAAVPALLAAGGFALGMTTAAVALTLGGVGLGALALLGTRLLRSDQARIAATEAKLEGAREQVEELQFLVHGKFSPAYEVKKLAEGLKAAGNSILQAGDTLHVGGVRLRTRS